MSKQREMAATKGNKAPKGTSRELAANPPAAKKIPGRGPRRIFQPFFSSLLVPLAQHELHKPIKFQAPPTREPVIPRADAVCRPEEPACPASDRRWKKQAPRPPRRPRNDKERGSRLFSAWYEARSLRLGRVRGHDCHLLFRKDS